MTQKLNELALGYSFAIIAVGGMLLTGIAGYFGWYLGFVEIMIQTHIFFNISVLGIIVGMVEASIWSFAFGFITAKIYNGFI